MTAIQNFIQISRLFPSKSQGRRGLKSRIEIDRHRCMPLLIIFCLNSFLNIPWGHICSGINNPQIRKIFPVQMDSEHIHFRNQKHPMYHSTVQFSVEPEYLEKTHKLTVSGFSERFFYLLWTLDFQLELWRMVSHERNNTVSFQIAFDLVCHELVHY